MGHRQDFQTLNVQLFLKKEIRRPDSFVWEGQSPFSKKAGAPCPTIKTATNKMLGNLPRKQGLLRFKKQKTEN